MVLLEEKVPASGMTASVSIVINNQAAHRHEGSGGRTGQEKPRGGGEAVLPQALPMTMEKQLKGGGDLTDGYGIRGITLTSQPMKPH